MAVGSSQGNHQRNFEWRPKRDALIVLWKSLKGALYISRLSLDFTWSDIQHKFRCLPSGPAPEVFCSKPNNVSYNEDFSGEFSSECPTSWVALVAFLSVPNLPCHATDVSRELAWDWVGGGAGRQNKWLVVTPCCRVMLFMDKRWTFFAVISSTSEKQQCEVMCSQMATGWPDREACLASSGCYCCRSCNAASWSLFQTCYL